MTGLDRGAVIARELYEHTRQYLQSFQFATARRPVATSQEVRGQS